MRESKIKEKLIAAIFLAVLLLPIFTISWKGAEYSENEKRNLASMPTIFLEDGKLNHDLGIESKNWLEDHIGLREYFLTLSANMKMKLFRQSPSSQVHIGKQGWYFYTQDENLEIASGEYTLSTEVLDGILYNHLAIKEKLAAKGIEYVILLPTSKVSIYPEYMRYGSGNVRETPVDIVADYLETRSDLKVIRLKESLLEAKKTKQVYYKTDTHWNQEGAFAAYQKIIQDMRNWDLCSTPPKDVDLVQATYLGEFGAMMGSVDLLSPEPTLNTVLREQNAIKNTASDQYDQLCQIMAQEGIRTGFYHYTNAALSDENKVLMFGDSMFASYNATEMLAEHFSQFTYIWDGNIRASMVDFLQPDIVIYELTERYLNDFPNKCLSFIVKPLSDYQAEIISYNYSDQVLEVLVRNTSSDTWSYLNQIKCCIWVDSRDCAIRALLEAGEEILPGGEAKLRFENLSETQLSSRLEIQMLQEGICYFGEKEPFNPS